MIEPLTNYVGLIKEFTWVDGDIAEFGCYNGGSCRDLATLGRTVWAFDTFDGMPAEDYTNDELDSSNPPGKFKPEHDVLAYLATIPNVIIKKGRYADTLPTIPAGTVFAIVYMDCDYYLSHKQVFDYLCANGHVVPGTLFVFDDYVNLPGAKKAVDEWRGDKPVTHNGKVVTY